MNLTRIFFSTKSKRKELLLSMATICDKSIKITSFSKDRKFIPLPLSLNPLPPKTVVLFPWLGVVVLFCNRDL